MAADLTARERQVLEETLRHGGSIKEAALELGIAHQTAKNLLTSAYRRLGVSTAIDAARALGMLEVPDPHARSA